MIATYTAKRQGSEFIGQAVTRTLNAITFEDAGWHVIAIVPRLLSAFGGHMQYEVTEVDIVIQLGEPWDSGE